MLEQRDARSIKRPIVEFPADPSVVPVLAIGPGEASEVALQHATELRAALEDLRPDEAGATAKTEIWRLDDRGNVTAKR
jgi:hypothetical protein